MSFDFATVSNIGIFGVLAKQSGALWYIGFLLCAVFAYLLGSFNFALIISKYRYKEDIRTHGSGNAGMTNMMRTYGRAAAVFTIVGDALKTVLSVIIGMLICGVMGAYVAGLFCVVGHVYPLFFGFKGGKGVVVTATMILCLNPLVFLLLFIIFAAIVAATKYISLGSVMCMLIYPLLLSRMSEPDFRIVIAIIIAAFVIFLHRSNIKRLWEGTENKFSFKKSVKPSDKKAPESSGEPQDGTENGGK